MSIRLDLVFEPTVTIVGRPSFDAAALARFLADHGVADYRTDAPSSAEALVESGGRLCYWSFERPRPGGIAAYVARLIAEGHTSVLEHATWTFIIAGISRRCCEQIVRHRVGWSPSQRSQRFVDETDGGVLSVVVPPALRGAVAAAPECPGTEAAVAGRDWLDALRAAAEVYDRLVSYLMDRDPDGPATARRKRAREAARSVLPNATATMVQVTANARSLRHFLALRSSPHADAEIRAAAAKLLAALRAEAPHLFADLATEDGR